MKITRRQLRRIIKEWRENPAKIRLARRKRDRQRMIDQMTFKQLKSSAFDSAGFINNRLRTGQYEYADIWEVEIPRLADYIDAAKIKAAEEGVAYDDIPEVIHNGGILDLSRYSLGDLPAGIGEGKKTKVTEQRLRQVIRNTLLREATDLDSLFAAATEEMGDYGPDPAGIPSHKGGEWGPDDWMEYLYEAEAEEVEDVDAAINYVKAAFPELAATVDEIFGEAGPRTLEPVYEAFAELLDTEEAPGDPLIQADTAPGAIRVSPIKVEDGMQYRWWLWGSNIDPYPIAIDAKGMDRDDKVYTAEEMFQQITGGKESKFKVPQGLYQ